MIHGAFAFALAAIVASSPSTREGVIEGVVANGSHNHPCAGGIEVVLRVRVDGQFIGVARTTTQPDGRYRFENLPVDVQGPYLPGANQDDIHFPGPRVWLSADQPHAEAELTIYESASDFNPLVIESQEIVVRAEPGMLKVTESIIVDNPSNYCYVGPSRDDSQQLVTLRLAIPSDFQRVTFVKEALGRRFAVDDGSLVTGMPWPPGKRELSFTYVVPNDQSHRVLERPIDLSCSHLSVQVHTEDPSNVSCNLDEAHSTQHGQLNFESTETGLPAGFVTRLELGRLPVQPIVYARRAAVVVLAALVLGVTLGSVRRRRRSPVPWQ